MRPSTETLRRVLPAVVLLPILVSARPIQDAVLLVEKGDLVIGVGNVTSLDNGTVNDVGDWLVEVDTDNPMVTADGAVLRNGAVTLIEGIPVPFPTGATLDTFDSVTLNRRGHSGWNFVLSGTTGASDNTGLFYDILLLVQEGSVSGAPEFSAGTTYKGFFETKFNDANTMMAMVTVDDPALTSSVDQALMILQLDASGALVSETAFLKEGDQLPGLTDDVTSFGTNPQTFAFNNLGDKFYYVDVSSSPATDGTFWFNSTLIAREGSPSPVPGRNFLIVQGRPVDINDLGDYLYRALLTGSTTDDGIMIKNGAKFVQEGDVLPATAPFVVTNFGGAPIYIGNTGDVFWYGEWSDPNQSENSGLFLNHDLIVEEGVTTIGGSVVDEIFDSPDTMAMSPSGLYLMFEARLEDGTRGIFLISRGGVTPIPSCAGNAATLEFVSGDVEIGSTFRLGLDQAQAVGSISFLAISNAAAPTFPPCGLPLAFGEILVDVAPPNPILLLIGPAWVGPAVPFDIALPNDPGLVGRIFYNQGLFADFGGPEKFRLSDAVQINVGS